LQKLGSYFGWLDWKKSCFTLCRCAIGFALLLWRLDDGWRHRAFLHLLLQSERGWIERRTRFPRGARRVVKIWLASRTSPALKLAYAWTGHRRRSAPFCRLEKECQRPRGGLWPNHDGHVRFLLGQIHRLALVAIYLLLCHAVLSRACLDLAWRNLLSTMALRR
jgi:hypothetical protein